MRRYEPFCSSSAEECNCSWHRQLAELAEQASDAAQEADDVVVYPPTLRNQPRCEECNTVLSAPVGLCDPCQAAEDAKFSPKRSLDFHRCKKCNRKAYAPATRCDCGGELWGIKYAKAAV